MIRFSIFLSLALSASAQFTIRQQGERIDIIENEELLTSYHDSRVPYIYPLPSDSGANLTRHWPLKKGVAGEQTDHPHHRSVWLSHGAVNGFDFWSWKGRGEPRISQKSVEALKSGDNFACFTVNLAWEAEGKTQMTENRDVRIERSGPKTWTLQIQSTLSAPDEGDVLLGDTKEGTFAARVDRTLRLKGPTAKGHIMDSEGRSDGACWGKRSKWVAFHGPDEKGEPAVIAMFDHPKNLRHPCWWHARDYGLLAANPFGIHDFEGKKDKTLGDHLLKRGETLTLRYLLLIHHGTPESASLEKHWAHFIE